MIGKQEGMQVRLSEIYLFPVEWQESLSKADLTGELCSRCVTVTKTSGKLDTDPGPSTKAYGDVR